MLDTYSSALACDSTNCHFRHVHLGVAMADILQLSVATYDIYSSVLLCQTFTTWCCHVRHLQLSVPRSDFYSSALPCLMFTAQCFRVWHLQLSVAMSDIYCSVFPCQTFTAQHSHVRHLQLSIVMPDIYSWLLPCQACGCHLCQMVHQWAEHSLHAMH